MGIGPLLSRVFSSFRQEAVEMKLLLEFRKRYEEEMASKGGERDHQRKHVIFRDPPVSPTTVPAEEVAPPVSTLRKGVKYVFWCPCPTVSRLQSPWISLRQRSHRTLVWSRPPWVEGSHPFKLSETTRHCMRPKNPYSALTTFLPGSRSLNPNPSTSKPTP